jgi:hypothetical protein
MGKDDVAFTSHAITIRYLSDHEANQPSGALALATVAVRHIINVHYVHALL